MPTLYHGTHETALPTIRTGLLDGQVFDGLFAASDHDAAASHARNVFAIQMPAERIASSFDLGQADHLLVRAALAAEVGGDDALIDALYDAVIDESAPDAFVGRISTRALGGCEFGAASWELQRLRGRVAAALGFAAVEMQDEHGTSYLIVEIP